MPKARLNGEQKTPAPRAADRSPDPSRDGIVRVATVMGIPGLLAEHGVDPAEVLAEFGFPADHLDHPENTVTARALGRLLGRCVERTGCPHFGLLVGQCANASAMGPVGFLAQSAPDVGTALRKLAAGFHTHDRMGTVSLAEEGDFVALSYALVQHDLAHAEQILDGAIAMGANIMRGLCGASWRPIEVRLAHRRPRNLQPFQQHFGMKPVFDSDWSGFVFSSSWLAKPNAGADLLLHAFMESRVREIVESGGYDLPEAVRRCLRRASSLERSTLAAVAGALGVTGRTLSRRLQAEGTSLRQLREEVLFETACRMIANTTKSATEIGAALGYADASAFTRAFARWSGTTPARWREDRRKTRPPRRRA